MFDGQSCVNVCVRKRGREREGEIERERELNLRAVRQVCVGEG